MERFREDNTEGYSAHDLVMLNRAYELACFVIDPDNICDKSVLDKISEVVQSEYDLQKSNDAR